MLHELRLTLDDQSFVVKGRVAHCQISDVEQEQLSYQAGFEFVDLTERAQDVIKQFLETVESAGHGRHTGFGHRKGGRRRGCSARPVEYTTPPNGRFATTGGVTVSRASRSRPPARA